MTHSASYNFFLFNPNIQVLKHHQLLPPHPCKSSFHPVDSASLENKSLFLVGGHFHSDRCREDFQTHPLGLIKAPCRFENGTSPRKTLQIMFWISVYRASPSLSPMPIAIATSKLLYYLRRSGVACQPIPPGSGRMFRRLGSRAEFRMTLLFSRLGMGFRFGVRACPTLRSY